MPLQQDEKNTWVKAANGHAPAGTLVGGQDMNGEPIYVARASHGGDLIPGKLVASHHCTYISFGGLEFKKSEYEVLVGSSNNWKNGSHNVIPPDAFPGGKTNLGEKLFVGRVHHNGNYTPGKVQVSESLCYIPFGGEELKFSNYEVLTY